MCVCVCGGGNVVKEVPILSSYSSKVWSGLRSKVPGPKRGTRSKVEGGKVQGPESQVQGRAIYPIPNLEWRFEAKFGIAS